MLCCLASQELHSNYTLQDRMIVPGKQVSHHATTTGDGDGGDVVLRLMMITMMT